MMTTSLTLLRARANSRLEAPAYHPSETPRGNSFVSEKLGVLAFTELSCLAR